jgi:hypothetical protein
MKQQGAPMSLHHKLDWNTAMRGMRNDRVTPAPGFLAARSMEVACLDRMAKEAAMVPFVGGHLLRPFRHLEGGRRSAPAPEGQGIHGSLVPVDFLFLNRPGRKLKPKEPS